MFAEGNNRPLYFQNSKSMMLLSLPVRFVGNQVKGMLFPLIYLIYFEYENDRIQCLSISLNSSIITEKKEEFIW